MPIITINAANIYYEDSSPNDANLPKNLQKPVLLFAHGLLWSTQLYDKQVAHFKKDYRCIAFDFRGQGQSQVTKAGYDMDTLAEDAIALLEALNIKQCHFIGLSMGGFVAQRVALKRPDLLQSLILLDTSADAEDKDKVAKYKMFIKAAAWIGINRLSKKVMPIMFGHTFLNDKSRKAEYKIWLARLKSNHKQGARRATLGVIERDEVYSQLGSIKTPTLIMVGDEDVSTPYPKAQRLHFAIEGSKLAVIQGAGHSSTIEAPEQVNQTIECFLTMLKGQFI